MTWQDYHLAQPVPADALVGDLLDGLPAEEIAKLTVEAAEDQARAAGDVAEVGPARVEWIDVTEDNLETLRAKFALPPEWVGLVHELEVGDRVCHVVIPCRREEPEASWQVGDFADPSPEEKPMDMYALVMSALNGNGWSTVEEVADRAGLPRLATNNTLTELVGAGKVFVKVDAARDPAGAVLVYTDEP